MSRLPESCDVAIVGAGPGGSLAALRLRRAGHRVVLIDRARFPRRKVCGACVGPAALHLLEVEGLGERIRGLSGHPLRTMELRGPDGQAMIRLQGNLAISRLAFDQMLVAAAREAGVDFVDGCRVRIGVVADGGVDLETPQGSLRASVVVDAAGLSGAARSPQARRSTRVASDSRIGAGASFPANAFTLPEGILQMVVGAEGYVGLVRVEDGSVNVAAALDPAAVAAHGIGLTVERLLRDAGVALPERGPLERWRGTPALTWSPATVASERVFRIGDAAGYVEPFTGEGMAWALEGAHRVTPLVDAAVGGWHDGLIEEWSRLHARTVARRRRTCHLLARGLRHGMVVRCAIAAAARAPFLASPFIRVTSRPRTCSPLGGGSS
jgi:flavin-dependent dehydrogenase